jgi:Prohead core protein serine protease
MPILEAPKKPTNTLIDEQLHDAKLTLIENKEAAPGRVFARGEFGHAGKPTANGRWYKHEIWESNIARLQGNLARKKVLGELDHPESGRTALQRASHVITDLRLEGDRVIGECEILDTTLGRDLKAILASGVPVGVSSRGFGSTKPDGSGNEVVQEDYRLVTFDFVAEPADDTAYPEVFYEGVEFPAEATMLAEDTDVDLEAELQRITEAVTKGEDPNPPHTSKDLPSQPASHSKYSDRDLLSHYQSAFRKMRNQKTDTTGSPDGVKLWGKEAANLAYEISRRGLKLPAKEDLEESVGPRVASGSPEEAALAARFLAKAYGTETPSVIVPPVVVGPPVSAAPGMPDASPDAPNMEAMRKEIAAEVLSAVGKARAAIEAEIRAEMLADPEVAGAKAALEGVKALLRPYVLPDDVNEVVEEKNAEIAQLRSRVQKLEERSAELGAVITQLTEAAKEAGYKYHLERQLVGESQADLIRDLVGDVTAYASASEVTAKVEEAKKKTGSCSLTESLETRGRSTERVQKLTEGLENALLLNKDLGLRLYAADRLTNHSQAAKIKKMLENSGYKSTEQIDAVLEGFREPAMDADSMESVRQRVRTLTRGGREHSPIQEDASRGHGGSTNRDYPVLGQSVSEFRQLSGINRN